MRSVEEKPFLPKITRSKLSHYRVGLRSLAKKCYLGPILASNNGVAKVFVLTKILAKSVQYNYANTVSA